MISINGIKITPTLFPDKTSQIWKIPDGLLGLDTVTIYWDFEHEGEIMHIAQLRDLIGFNPNAVRLYLGYLPYGRQDKQIDNTQTFALRSFARQINAMNFDQVLIFDPHSPVAESVIHKCKPVYPIVEVDYAFAKVGANLLAYPDDGATKKYGPLFQGYEAISGKKNRNPLTGIITDYEIFGDVKEKTVLIVDDICDGGATFTLLTKSLYNQGADSVHLYVSHGIFSRGLEILHDAGVKRIFTKNGEVDS